MLIQLYPYTSNLGMSNYCNIPLVIPCYALPILKRLTSTFNILNAVSCCDPVSTLALMLNSRNGNILAAQKKSFWRLLSNWTLNLKGIACHRGKKKLQISRCGQLMQIAFSTFPLVSFIAIQWCRVVKYANEERDQVLRREVYHLRPILNCIVMSVRFDIVTGSTKMKCVQLSMFVILCHVQKYLQSCASV